MNEQIDPASKAEAARAREEEARQKSQKNTIIFPVPSSSTSRTTLAQIALSRI